VNIAETRQHCLQQISNVSKNRFDLDSTIGQTFGHASDANGRVKINGHMITKSEFNFNSI